MKTTFNKKDLVRFGNYLLSKDRKIENKENKNKVHNEDIENFIAKSKKVALLFLLVFAASCTPDEEPEQYQEPALSCEEINSVYAQKLKDLLSFKDTMTKEMFDDYYQQYTTEREKYLKENGCN